MFRKKDPSEPPDHVRVYEYGARPPENPADRSALGEQMFLSHRYKNKLVEIELARRTAVRTLLSAHVDVEPLQTRVDALAAELNTLYTDVASARSKRAVAKKRGEKSSEALAPDAKRAAELRAALKAARVELRAAKQAVKEDVQISLGIAAANEAASAAVRAARAAFAHPARLSAEELTKLGLTTPPARGLYWGSYLVVEQAADQARKGKMDPSFKRSNGEGHLAVQISKGLDTKDIFGTQEKHDTRAWIETEPGRRDRVLHFRYGSHGSAEEGTYIGEDAPAARSGVFAKLRFKMHRELPPGRIKWVHVIKRRVADQERWFVQFVVSMEGVTEAVARSDCDKVTQPPLALDVGWRLKENGDLRVAYGVSASGSSGGTTMELVLPAALLKKDEHVAGLASLRDKLLNEMKAKVTDCLTKLTTVSSEEHLSAMVVFETVSQWRNPGRFMSFVRAVEKGAYVEGLAWKALPTKLREEIRAYAHQDRHLWQWQDFERRKVQHQRREIYRLFAVSIARKHERVVLEDFDLRVFARRGTVDVDSTTDSRPYMRLRALACVSALRDTITQACASRRVPVEIRSAAYTTLDCHVCGHRHASDSALAKKLRDEVVGTCEKCGATWDQDENAARNLLKNTPAPRLEADAKQITQDSKKAAA